MTTTNNDLSPYELARLQRIKRNQERLRSLGLLGSNALKSPPKPNKKATATKRKTISRRQHTAPTRSSKRLKALKDGGGEIIADVADKTETLAAGIEGNEAEDKVNYRCMPEEPDELDDNEFQVYTSLRAWRLRKKNELEVEPYKICQNRTLCELIRKKRNDVTFACEGVGSNEQTEEVEQDLLSVWGIGPSKAAPGGFAWEMLEVLGSEENVELLEVSRKVATPISPE